MQDATIKVFTNTSHVGIASFLATSKIYLESTEYLTASKTAALMQVATDSRETANVSIKPVARWIGLRIEAQIRTFNLAMRNLAAKDKPRLERTCLLD